MENFGWELTDIWRNRYGQGATDFRRRPVSIRDRLEPGIVTALAAATQIAKGIS